MFQWYRRRQLTKALKKAGQPWEAGETPVSRLSGKRRQSLCGVQDDGKATFTTLPPKIESIEQ